MAFPHGGGKPPAAEIQGPESYAAGGFVVDLSHKLPTLRGLQLTMTGAPAGAAPVPLVELNSPEEGQATIKVLAAATGAEIAAGTDLRALRFAYLAS